MGDQRSMMDEKRNVFQNRQPIPEPSPVNYYAASQPPSPRQTGECFAFIHSFTLCNETNQSF